MCSRNIPDLDLLVRDGAIKLEITEGIPTWEASPSSRHQSVIDHIRASIEPKAAGGAGCECAHLADVSIRFADGSIKRPDISIFCTRPPIQDDALTVIPEAVIEIISPGYEYKDIALNPQFYLGQGLTDVVIVDPRSGEVKHYHSGDVATYSAPVTLDLQCGCRCIVPLLGETA